ncbi:hypothetical protein KM043_017874 [Ampulex compressa]|nr:hypothetical protein KM043_017874 [Ampulex compressa]
MTPSQYPRSLIEMIENIVIGDRGIPRDSSGKGAAAPLEEDCFTCDLAYYAALSPSGLSTAPHARLRRRIGRRGTG